MSTASAPKSGQQVDLLLSRCFPGTDGHVKLCMNRNRRLDLPCGPRILVLRVE